MFLVYLLTFRINSLYDEGKDSTIALQKENIKAADADKCAIAILDDQILKLNTIVKMQQNEIEFKRKEAEHFRFKIEKTLQKYDEINRIKESRDISLMEEDKLLEVMANLSSSHIQGFYDYIMDLEKIIENGGKDNVKPALKYIENNENLSYILSKLEIRLDSTDINWKNLLNITIHPFDTTLPFFSTSIIIVANKCNILSSYIKLCDTSGIRRYTV